MCMGIDPMEKRDEKQFSLTLEERIVENEASGPHWSLDGCSTEYKNLKRGKMYATLVCRCNIMNNKYFSVVNDYTRLSAEKVLDPGQYLNILLLVIIPMAIFIIIVPITVVKLDIRDYEAIEQDKCSISDQLFADFTEQTGLSYKQEAYYKMIDIEYYRTLSHIQPNSINSSNLAAKNFHPLFSIFSKFDYRLRRMTRLALLMIQTNVIAILIMASTFKLQQLGGIFEPKSPLLLLLSILLSLFTLPLPECLIDVLRAKIMIKRVKRKGAGYEDVTYLHDPSLQIKFGLVSIGFFLYMAVFSLLLCFYTRGGDDDSWFRVGRTECHNFVLVYYLSIVMFGWYFLNFMFRTWLISKFAAKQADTNHKQIKARQEAIRQEGDKAGVNHQQEKNCQCCFCGDRGCCTCFFVPKEAIEQYFDAIVVISLQKDQPFNEIKIIELKETDYSQGEEEEGDELISDKEKKVHHHSEDQEHPYSGNLDIKGKNKSKSHQEEKKDDSLKPHAHQESNNSETEPKPKAKAKSKSKEKPHKVRHDKVTGLPKKTKHETDEQRKDRKNKEKDYFKKHPNQKPKKAKKN